MTPIGSRLKLALEDEEQRMHNEWFFKWHHIGGSKVVEIDSFRGRPITYAGTGFSGSAHQVYWNTIQLYLRKKISSVFDELEQELSDYPLDIRRAAIEEVKRLIAGFANRIRRAAVEKDRVLRGNGIDFPEARDFGRWEGCHNSDIENRAAGLMDIYCRHEEKGSKYLERANRFYDNHRLLLTVIGIILAILGILLAL